MGRTKAVNQQGDHYKKLQMLATTREMLQEYAAQCRLPYKQCGSACARSSAKFLCLSASGQARGSAQVAAVQATAVRAAGNTYV